MVPSDTAVIGMFPLSTVLFPDGALPLHVFEPRYLTLLHDCLAGAAGAAAAAPGAVRPGAARRLWAPIERSFGVVLIARGSEVGGGDERFDLGTLAQIGRMAHAGDGRRYVLAQGVERIRVVRWLDDDPYPRAEVEPRPALTAARDKEAITAGEAAVRRVRSLLSEFGELPALPFDLPLARDTDTASWQLCELAPLNPLDRQRLLTTDATSERMDLLCELCDATAADVATLLSEERPD